MSSTKITFVYSNVERAKEIEYSVLQLAYLIGWRIRCVPVEQLGNLSLDETGLVISYGKRKPDISDSKHIHIWEAAFFGDSYMRPDSVPETVASWFEETPILFIGERPTGDGQPGSDSVLETDFDVIASTFFMLSRYEERLTSERDSYDRIPATSSLAYRERFLDRPVVHEYADLLHSWSCEIDCQVSRQTSRTFSLCLTHDIDQLRLFGSFRRSARAVLRVLANPNRISHLSRLGLDAIGSRLGTRRDPFDTFDDMLSFERESGIRSTYFVMAGGKTKYDGRYTLSEIEPLLARLQEDGHEIALHGSFESYNNREMLRSEKRLLESVIDREISGNRQHYLRFAVGDTWQAADFAGLEYDASLGYADHEGFRAGICVPYRPFDLVTRRVLPLWELPLIVMDGTLQSYRALSVEAGSEAIQRLCEQVRRHLGAMTFLWHNSSTYELEFPGWDAALKHSIQAAVSKGAIPMTVQETIQEAKRRCNDLRDGDTDT